MKPYTHLSLAAMGATLTLNSCQTTPPNVLVIIADDQGWGDLSINGNQTLQTPNIDRIGHEGVQMENFYVCPVSAPTRAEFLSGRYAHRSGVTGVSEGLERMSPSVPTIANVFHDAGYATGLFGKWHNGTQYPYHPNARGFAEFFGFCSGHWGSYIDAPLLDHNGAIVSGEGFLTDEISQRAMDYMNQSDEQPFFVVLAMNTPHSPMQVTDEWWDKWKDAAVKQDATLAEAESDDFTRAAIALNDNMDWNVGRVLESLEASGKLDNTIIVYFSDNGPNSHRWNGEMRGIKASVDEGGVRSTLLMRWGNRLKASSKIAQLSGVVDLLPTLASMCGITHDIDGLDGMDMSPYLTGEKTLATSRELFSVWDTKTGVRRDGYLLSNDDKLYDTRVDREQQHPLTSHDQLYDSLVSARNEYVADLKECRLHYANTPYTVGHPDEVYSRLPARDATFAGNIVRSNQYPNCSYLTNWTGTEDKITWNVDVLADGRFEVILYYACDKQHVGATLQCDVDKETVLSKQLCQDSPTTIHAEEYDRTPRGESPMMDFGTWSMGDISLKEGLHTIELSANSIPNTYVMDVALVVLKRIDE